MCKRLIWLTVTALAFSTAVFAKDKKREDPNIRMVQGTVTDSNSNGIQGAIVQLKNTKNLQIRSFITKEGGTYYFNNLDTNVDYELKAEHDGKTSSVKTLSAFDNRKQPVINLKLP